jgi:2-polyprenyl-3-methyl-5-hydroxy-6-metoxy-1,4-benzoquinol methylase
VKESYLKYYRKYSARAPIVFAFDYWRAKTKLRKLVLTNLQKDYVELAENPERLKLHLSINEILCKSETSWPHHDYGEGYFYQSFKPAGIRGLRNTEERAEIMDLKNLVAGKRVLDIGCNSGFIALTIADAAQSVVGFDINSFHVRVGSTVAAHLGIENVHLHTSAFEDWDSDERFEVVFSFANHSTYDQQTHQDVETYFRKCEALLEEGGLLVFESHSPDFEGDKLAGVLNLLQSMYDVAESRVLDYGTFLDTGRTFMVCKKRHGGT